MSDDTNKADVEKDTNIEEKPKAVKKPTTAKKKAKEKDDSNTENESNKNRIIEKLQSMGVMSGGKAKAEKPGHKHEKGELVKVFVASAVVVLVVSSFVWALNKEASERKSLSNINAGQAFVTNAMQPNYSPPWQSAVSNPYNNVSRQPGENNPTHVDINNNYEKQRKEWLQRQQKLQEQQRVQQQKWMKQQQQQQEQYMKWVQQQRAQQMQQQQKWNQQQPYYSYQQNNGYQGQQPQPQYYNYAPAYQQPQQYYRR